ncbi:MAG: tRNA pseudouridine(55) synthase TruB [Bacteroidetes bacterium]|nr:tRNA pseudouridine(55) synthase TruB [Bacteroidota bacterium]MCL5033999.1 tRNA pseudouridine(55) synthase TruB [Bacteroidota bacterium]
MTTDRGMIIPVYKPKGLTSFEVVRRVRRELNLKKIGHSGTLDPLAEGLLILLTGSETKSMTGFLKLDKEYLATLRLGVVSKSHDLETELVERASSVEDITSDRIDEVLRKFTGKIEQVPPDFSATWVNGKRAYKLARKGVKPDLKPKLVTVDEIRAEKIALPMIQLRIVCSSGTYVRSLARDIGEELGCGAVLTDLVRTRIGSYKIEEAVRIEELRLRYVA